MYNKNILTPLKTFVSKVQFISPTVHLLLLIDQVQISNVVSQYLENPHAAPENAQRLMYDFADNVVTTMWCLS